MSDAHTCPGYSCDRPECVRGQRDELRERCERIRYALRELAIKPLYGGDLCAIVGQQCVVCGARTIYGSAEEPSHAEGCLAA